MKNRLLEDIGDSQSGVPVRPVRRVQAASPPPPPRFAEASPPGEPAGAPEAFVRQRAGVWRTRPAYPAPTPAPQLTEAPEAPPAPPPAPPPVAPDIASFSSREPDWPIPLQPDAPPWTERWGRKALGWSAGLAALVAVAATAAWMYRDTQVETTLAVVADHSPAAASDPEPPPPPPPPLRLLPPEPLLAAPEPLPAAPEPTAPVAAAPEPKAAVPAVVPVARPTVKRSPERRAAAAAATRRSRPETKKTAPRPARERVLARAPALPARTAPVQQAPQAAPELDPESPLAETLRLCRAAGYHATACLKRGCEATRFGLVCRG